MTSTVTAPAATHETIAVSKIALHPRNPRRAVGNVDDLAASMLEVGILEDLIVAPWPTGLKERKPRGAEYVLIAGHRRLAGAKAAKLTEVPVKVRADLDTLGKQLKAALVENLHRADLTAVEEADTYQELMELEGLTQTALAKQVGQPVTRVRERLKLAKLAPPVKEKVHGGQLTIADAIAVESFAGDAKTHKELLKHVGTSNFRHSLTMAERDRQAAADLEATLKPYREAGVNIVEHDGYDLPKGWKSAATIITGSTQGYVDRETAAKWDAEEHKDCPGRAIVLRYGREVRFACSDGKLHPQQRPQKSEAELKQAAADKARRDMFTPASEAATAVRRRHIADALSAAGPGHAAHCRPHLVDAILHVSPWATDKDKRARHIFVAELLAVGLDDVMSVEEQRGHLEAAIAKLTLEGLVLLHAVVIEHIADETKLAEIPRDGRWYGHAGDWIKMLDTVFGYEFSTWERKTFNVDERLAPPPEEATPEAESTAS